MYQEEDEDIDAAGIGGMGDDPERNGEELSLEELAELESEGNDHRSHTFSPDDEGYYDGAYFEE